jgi:RNA polymerase sigma factor (sigma-70 family)
MPHDDRANAVSTQHVLMAALATLPPRQRAVVVLRFFHDYTEVATAEAMGITVGTVKSQTFKALAALRVSEELCDDKTFELTDSAREGILR